jgi:hypothetical protein
LRQIGGIVFVLQTTDEVVKQFPAVTIHQIVQRGILPGREAAHIGTVESIEAVIPLARLLRFIGRAAHSLTASGKLALPQRRLPSNGSVPLACMAEPRPANCGAGSVLDDPGSQHRVAHIKVGGLKNQAQPYGCSFMP